MSGHSKWNNIKRKKEKTDGARAKVFTKIVKKMNHQLKNIKMKIQMKIPVRKMKIRRRIQMTMEKKIQILEI